jgi:hypothetical protein
VSNQSRIQPESSAAAQLSTGPRFSFSNVLAAQPQKNGMKFCNKAVAVFLFACSANLVYGLPVTSRYNDNTCGAQCRFTLCSKNGPLTPGTQETAISAPICDKYNKVCVGHVDATYEACIQTGYASIPISQYAPAGLQHPFSATFWKTYGFHDGNSQQSGVGHETPLQNQLDFLHGRCFILPLAAYQVLDRPHGQVIGNVHPIDKHIDCVGFTVY